jgi:hypothetical protein
MGNSFRYVLRSLNEYSTKASYFILLSFVPFASESFGFTGHLYVTLDSAYFVRKAILNVAQDINLNFISRMTIEQDFERGPDSTRVITKDDISVDFKLSERMDGSLSAGIIRA